MSVVDVRNIVLEIVDANPEARRAYLHEPAMHHGVEVTIGVLGRTADVLMSHGRHSPEETAALIRQIAIACSRRGGPENEQAIAAANGQLHPPGPGPGFRRIGPQPPSAQEKSEFSVLAVETPRAGGGVHYAKAVIWRNAPPQRVEQQFQALERDLLTYLNGPQGGQASAANHQPCPPAGT